MNPLPNVTSLATKLAGGILVSLMLLVACASTPPIPHDALQAAEQAIDHAEQARVADYASPELGEARTKLTAARNAAENRQMVLARHLAEQSRLSAELAIAKAESAKAKEINDEIQESIDAMKQEMQRSTGGRP